MENTLRIIVDDEKTQRLLREVLHQLKDIYKVLDTADDISDVTEKMKLTIQQLKGIVPETEE